jgi:hypothetical protein
MERRRRRQQQRKGKEKHFLQASASVRNDLQHSLDCHTFVAHVIIIRLLIKFLALALSEGDPKLGLLFMCVRVYAQVPVTCYRWWGLCQKQEQQTTSLCCYFERKWMRRKKKWRRRRRLSSLVDNKWV